MGGGSRRLDRGDRWDVGTGYLSPPWLGSGVPKRLSFHLKWRVLMHSERYFSSMSSPE